jgi:PAS domain S-box-containing protein
MQAAASRRQRLKEGSARGPGAAVAEQQLFAPEPAHAHAFFQATLDSLPAQIVVLDEHGEIIMSNRAWRELSLGSSVAPVAAIGANYLAACDSAAGDEPAARVAAGLREIIHGTSRSFTTEYPCQGPDHGRWFLMRAAAYGGPGTARVVISHDDITVRGASEAEVSTQAALLDEIDVAVISTGMRGEVTQWNSGAEHLYGWTRAEALGRDSAELVVAAGGDTLDAMLDELRRDGRWDGNLLARRKDSSTFPANVRSRVVLDKRGKPAGRIGVSVDMTKQVESERALLAARNYLRAVTDCMGEGLCTIDPGGRLIYMNAAAEKLLGWSTEELCGRVMHEMVHVGCSDGDRSPAEDCPILCASRDGVTVRIEDDVFVRRDGRSLPVAYTATPFVTDEGIDGCAVVFEDITGRKARQEDMERDVETLSWIGRIQDALEQDRFELFAQPIIDLGSGEVVQRELLLRMREPDGSIVGPISYLPIAEQYGLIDDIDRWVIKRATEIAVEQGAVELNLSARSIGNPSVLDDIERCLAQSAADPSRLVFEITETALIADETGAKAFADRLHAIGCKLALDDFGTGYGGFTYLKQLPVDFLKIDIEFVRDLSTNPASRHVVEAVVALARAFGLQTVAEGVEDAEALELARELGVDFAQGYHIARPAPVEQLQAPARAERRS